MKRILVVTSSFPYGWKETYFDNELKYLSKEFEEILILPYYNSYASDNLRSVPANVKVLKPLLIQGFRRIKAFITSFKIIRAYFKEYLNQKVILNVFKKKIWFNSYALYLGSEKRISELIKSKRINQHLGIYSYYAKAPLLVTTILKNYTKILRNFDLIIGKDNGHGLAAIHE